jgi:hypothetical protein
MAGIAPHQNPWFEAATRDKSKSTCCKGDPGMMRTQKKVAKIATFSFDYRN